MKAQYRRCSFHQQPGGNGNGTHYSFGLPVRNWFSKTVDGNMSRNGFDNLFTVLAGLNFRKFCEGIGIDSGKNVRIQPEHKDRIVVVEKRSPVFINCDGLFTIAPELLLSLFPADCFPVIFTDKNGNFAGLVHGSGKSVEAGVIKKAVQLSEEFGASPKNLTVAIGPGIGAWSCKHHTELLDEILKQLWDNGVDKKNIILSYLCTCCAKDLEGLPLFFSHKREKSGARFAVVVQMKPFNLREGKEI